MAAHRHNIALSDLEPVPWMQIVIGKGQYGVAYKVRHKRTGRHLVLKNVVIAEESSVTDKSSKQLTKMMGLDINVNMKKLKHEYLADYVGMVNERVSSDLLPTGTKGPNSAASNSQTPMNVRGMLMEYADHLSLDNVICRLRDFRWEIPLLVKLTIAFRVAHTMEYLHSRSPAVLHGNIKLGNVLIFNDLQVKLSDYGHANWLQAAIQNGLRPATDLVHTAPEVLTAKQHTTASDVYSFGIFLFELLTGYQAFGKLASRGRKVLKKAIADGERPAEKDLPAETPPPILKLVTECWLPEAQERPAFVNIRTILKAYIESRPKELHQQHSRDYLGMMMSLGPTPVETIPGNLSPHLQHGAASDISSTSSRGCASGISDRSSLDGSENSSFSGLSLNLSQVDLNRATEDVPAAGGAAHASYNAAEGNHRPTRCLHPTATALESDLQLTGHNYWMDVTPEGGGVFQPPLPLPRSPDRRRPDQYRKPVPQHPTRPEYVPVPGPSQYQPTQERKMKTQCKGPITRCMREIHGKDMDIFADYIGHCWKGVGRKLGLHEGVLDQAEADNSFKLYERARAMLKSWHERKGAKATMKLLVKALNDTGRGDVAEYLKEEYGDDE